MREPVLNPIPIMHHWEEYRGGTRRAPRFPLEFPLSYRGAAEAFWREGRGANISRSGLLFQTAAPLKLHDRLEVIFSVPVRIPGRAAAIVVCRGQVVRQVEQMESGVFVAATIESYRFRRQVEPS
jgi:PilZ domain